MACGLLFPSFIPVVGVAFVVEFTCVHHSVGPPPCIRYHNIFHLRMWCACRTNVPFARTFVRQSHSALHNCMQLGVRMQLMLEFVQLLQNPHEPFCLVCSSPRTMPVMVRHGMWSMCSVLETWFGGVYTTFWNSCLDPPHVQRRMGFQIVCSMCIPHRLGIYSNM